MRPIPYFDLSNLCVVVADGDVAHAHPLPGGVNSFRPSPSMGMTTSPLLFWIRQLARLPVIAPQMAHPHPRVGLGDCVEPVGRSTGPVGPISVALCMPPTCAPLPLIGTTARARPHLMWTAPTALTVPE